MQRKSRLRRSAHNLGTHISRLYVMIKVKLSSNNKGQDVFLSTSLSRPRKTFCSLESQLEFEMCVRARKEGNFDLL